MEKLLILGCSLGTEKALEYAESLGVYTIITDYNPPEASPLKYRADEYWMIDVFDQDALEERCRQEKITAVFAATSEFCLDQAKELCRRLELPFYASDEGWACARNKAKFKRHCMDCGISVPRSYDVTSDSKAAGTAAVKYPVIVKPADSCAQQGLSVCRDEEELEAGVKKALSFSETDHVLVEDYIEGNELAIEYCFINGKAVPIEICEMVYIPVNGKNNFVFALINGPRQKEYLKKISSKIEGLFDSMDCHEGIAFVQAIRREETFYFLELGYRIPASGNWGMTYKLSGIHPVEFVLDHALNRSHGTYLGLNPDDKVAGSYMIWARPGKIKRIQGEAEVRAIEGAEIVLQRFREGDCVPENSSMNQMAYNIALTGNDLHDLEEKVRRINHLLHVCDEEDKDMLFYLTDYELLK